jgi:FkbH-like protein
MHADLREARERSSSGDALGALDALARVAMVSDDVASWIGADRLAARLVADPAAGSWPRRRLRIALLSSHTSAHLAAALRVAALAHRVLVETYESGYRTFEQEILDETSGLYAFRPDVVVLAVDHRETRLADQASDLAGDVRREVDRWHGLWDLLRRRTGALVVQHTFVAPVDDPWGEAGATATGGRRRALRRLNLELGDGLPPGVHLVDAEAVAFTVGADVWFDPRYWYASKHAVGLGAVGHLAQRTTDVVVAALGLARKVLVLDLDNTLWGGVIGEDGLGGIVLGGGPEGEAFVDLQRYVRELSRRGIVLAVCSKNSPDDARLPFGRHPDMQLTLDDFVVFEASWDPKPDMLRRIAASIGVGTDALVLVDDNPLERALVRHELPEVGVVELPPEPSGYVRALARFPGLQSAGLTTEDARRTEQYRARSRGLDLERRATSREEFLRSLDMVATIEERHETNRSRIVQLIGKTNQLNLTGRRHTDADVERLASVDGAIVWAMRVRDVFDDHGIVAALVAVPDGPALRLDTFVMSCRVLGRTAELALLGALVERAAAAGWPRIVGEFVPTGRNSPAAGILGAAGFRLVGTDDAGVQTWELLPGRDAATPPDYFRLLLPDPAGTSPLTTA